MRSIFGEHTSNKNAQNCCITKPQLETAPAPPSTSPWTPTIATTPSTPPTPPRVILLLVLRLGRIVNQKCIQRERVGQNEVTNIVSPD